MSVNIKNPKAFRDYNIIETFEVGIELKGTEVKSLRDSQASLRESFAHIENKQLFLYNMHIAPYLEGSIFNVEPKRKRKLLLHKKQINKLIIDTFQKGFILVPIKLYFKGSFAKIELGLGTGKKRFDKRKSIKKKELNLALKRTLRQKNR